MTDPAFDHSGSAFDDFLADEGFLDGAEASAVRRVLGWQLSEATKARGVDRDALAARMGAGRPEVDRLLDADGPDDLAALARAARALGEAAAVRGGGGFVKPDGSARSSARRMRKSTLDKISL